METAPASYHSLLFRRHTRSLFRQTRARRCWMRPTSLADSRSVRPGLGRPSADPARRPRLLARHPGGVAGHVGRAGLGPVPRVRVSGCLDIVVLHLSVPSTSFVAIGWRPAPTGGGGFLKNDLPDRALRQRPGRGSRGGGAREVRATTVTRTAYGPGRGYWSRSVVAACGCALRYASLSGRDTDWSYLCANLREPPADGTVFDDPSHPGHAAMTVAGLAVYRDRDAGRLPGALTGAAAGRWTRPSSQPRDGAVADGRERKLVLLLPAGDQPRQARAR